MYSSLENRTNWPSTWFINLPVALTWNSHPLHQYHSSVNTRCIWDGHVAKTSLLLLLWQSSDPFQSATPEKVILSNMTLGLKLHHLPETHRHKLENHRISPTFWGVNVAMGRWYWGRLFEIFRRVTISSFQSKELKFFALYDKITSLPNNYQQIRYSQRCWDNMLANLSKLVKLTIFTQM